VEMSLAGPCLAMIRLVAEKEPAPTQYTRTCAGEILFRLLCPNVNPPICTAQRAIRRQGSKSNTSDGIAHLLRKASSLAQSEWRSFRCFSLFDSIFEVRPPAFRIELQNENSNGANSF
jgi:hypothetical protein